LFISKSKQRHVIDPGIGEVLAGLVLVAAASDLIAVAEAVDGMDDNRSNVDCKGAIRMGI
jgi:hypothetical protein